MAANNKQLRKPEQSAVDLAVAAVAEGNVNPLDDEGMSAVNPDRTSLDLPEEEHQETCSRCSRPAVDVCSKCGSPLCEECAGLSGTEG
jgi:hypothetical protein